jgi:2,5-furandicarboxylate decarboxylase 1
MPDQSIRSHIAALLQQGELTRFTKEIDPDENLSAVSWQNFARRGQACLFENVKGHPGWRVTSQIVADRRKWAAALGVPEHEVVTTLNERIGISLDPVIVPRDGAPVKEVIRLGKDVDLRTLPAMWTSQADPGRYIASGMCVIKDPHTGIRNVSFHRAQIVGPDRTGYLICPRQALKIYQMYGELNRPMEAAMVIGAHPLLAFCAGFVAPYGQDEFALAGGLLGEPVRMVKCETIDMEVPADAELVLEGELLPGEMTPEGPFGEVTGGYAQEGSTPMFRVKAITHRRDPIFYAMQCGLPPSDAHSIVCTTIEMKLWDHLRSVAGGLDLLDVRCIAGMSPMMVVLKLRPKFAGQARAALLAAVSSPYLHPKIAVAVDEDIDISDTRQVYWAMTHRVRRADDVQKINRARVFALDNASPIEEGMSAMYRVGTKVLIDATEDPALPRASWTGYRASEASAEPRALADRAAIAQALTVAEDGLLETLGKRLRSTARLVPAMGAKAYREDKIALAPGQRIGGILAAGARVGLVEMRHENGKLIASRLPWRLRRTAPGKAAFVVGAPAASLLGAALDGWRGRDGWTLASAMAGAPAAVTPLAGVSIPADAAFVVEGTLHPEAGGWTLEIETVSSAGPVPAQATDIGALEALATEIATYEHLRQVEGGLDVLDVRCFPETAHRLVVVKLRPRVQGQSKTACMAALSSADIGPKLVIAVDDDIDATDLREVSWSFASRLHAEFDVAVIEGLPEPAAAGVAPGLKWFVDSTMPPLTQKVNRADFTRATPKNLPSVSLADFLPQD